MAITVVGDAGCLERKIAPSANVFETPESAIEHAKESVVGWIKQHG
jgi:hypothetical protein